MVDILKFIDENDMDQLMNLWLESNLDAHSFISENYWKGNFNDVKKALRLANIIVYKEKGNIIGFMGVVDAYIAGIFVNKSNRSKGIGYQLLETAKKKYSSLTLDVYVKNDRAVNFYLSNGFKKVSTKLDKENNEKEILMQWDS